MPKLPITMRFATVGDNPELHEVASTLVEGGGFWLAAVSERPLSAPTTPRTEHVEVWEDLLKFPNLELVVVAAAEPDEELLRKLVQAGVALLMIHPVCTAIVAIELEMIRDDVRTVIATYDPFSEHPLFDRLLETVADSQTLGEIQQVVMRRQQPKRDDPAVLQSLRRDCEALRRLSGRMRHVNAMGEAGKGVGFHNLSVNMTSQNDIVHRWSVAPGEDEVSLTVIGEQGEASLRMDRTSVELRLPDETISEDLAEGREKTLSRLVQSPAPQPDWAEIRHALEIAEAAERSAVKGKTIELFNETYTEESSFKGLMAIGGCGLLLFTFLFMIVWSAVEGVRLPAERNRYERERAMAEVSPDERPAEVTSSWPLALRLWPAYPFAIFLLLQFLRLVFPKQKGGGDEEPEPRRPGGT